MRNRYKISLLVIAMLLAFSMTLGTSYAYWTTTVTQTKTNEVVAGCLEIELNDLSVDGESTSINLDNAYPMSDERGLNTKPYSLTITNVCNINAKYTVLLNTLSTSNLTENEIKYHFVQTYPGTTTMTPVLLNSLPVISVDNAIQDEIGLKALGTVQSSYALGEGVLNAQTDTTTDSVTYNLRLWIDEEVGNSVMGSSYQAAVAVYAEATK